MYNIFCSSFALLYFALLAAVSQLLNDGLRHFLQLYPVIVHYFVDKLKTFRRGRASESMRYVAWMGVRLKRSEGAEGGHF